MKSQGHSAQKRNRGLHRRIEFTEEGVTIVKWVTLAGVLAGASVLIGGGSALAATSPATALPPMTAWYWGGNGGITVDYSGSFVGFPFSQVPSSSVMASWGGVDNPAPLLWYAQHVNKTWLGFTLFGGKYTATLITKMKAATFVPSMVGGINSPGMSGGTSPTSTPSSVAPTSPSPAPTHSTTPSQSVQPIVSHTVVATPTHSVTPTHTSVPTSSTTTTAKPVATKTSPPAHTTHPSVSRSMSVTPPSAPVSPSNQAGVTYAQYRSHLAAETAPQHHHTAQAAKRTWIWAVAAGVILGGGAIAWRVWRHSGTF